MNASHCPTCGSAPPCTCADAAIRPREDGSELPDDLEAAAAREAGMARVVERWSRRRLRQ